MVTVAIPPCEICVLNNSKTIFSKLSKYLPNNLGGVRKQVPIHASCAAGWLCATALMSYCAAHIASLYQETRVIFGINSHRRVVKICALGAHHYIGYLFAVEYER